MNVGRSAREVRNASFVDQDAERGVYFFRRAENIEDVGVERDRPDEFRERMPAPLPPFEMTVVGQEVVFESSVANDFFFVHIFLVSA